MSFFQAGARSSFLAASAGSNDQTSAAEKQAQQNALAALLSVLLSAGYFRARITALSPFDKVVGGLAWAITSSGAALDADILYDDELGLGQKIQLAETVVKVLRSMSCPYPLQAHQIQGGDYASIVPVVKWLVTQVVEYRRITGDAVRWASESAFDRQYVPYTSAFLGPGAASSPAALASCQVLEGGRAEGTGSAAAGQGAQGSVIAAQSPGHAYTAEVAARYRPARMYRRPGLGQGHGLLGLPPAGGLRAQTAQGKSGDIRAQSVLLEFGDRTPVRASALGDGDGDGPGSAGSTASGSRKPTSSSLGQQQTSQGQSGQGSEWDRKMAAMQRAASSEDEERRRAAVELEKTMMTTMQAVEPGRGPGAGAGGAGTASAASAAGGQAVSGSNVGALVGLQAEELRKAAEEYRLREEELKAMADSGELLANSRHGRAAAHARRVAGLQKRVEDRDVQVSDACSAVSSLESSLAELRDSLAKGERYNGRALGELAKLESTIAGLSEGHRALVMTLLDLHVKVQGLLEQEQRFKASARGQMVSFQARLACLQAQASGGDDAAAAGPAQQLQQLEASHAALEERLTAARTALAAQCREVSRLSRALDDIPSRPELVQYERTFTDLYDTVAGKLDETRRYYVIYNGLDKRRTWAAKEVSLLSSMLSGLEAGAMKTDKGRKGYQEQVEGILRGLEESLVKTRANAESKQASRDSAASIVQSLVESQRAYYRAVKQLQEEAERYEGLVARLAGTGQ